MKPSTALVLRMLREHPDGVTTSQLLQGGAGSRYSSRVFELRHDHGYQIDEHRIRQGSSLYTLVSCPVDAEQGAGTAETPASVPLNTEPELALFDRNPGGMYETSA